MLEKIGGRKFIFGLLLVIMGFVFVILGKTDTKTFFDFAELIGGGYVIGNVASKFVVEK